MWDMTVSPLRYTLLGEGQGRNLGMLPQVSFHQPPHFVGTAEKTQYCVLGGSCQEPSKVGLLEGVGRGDVERQVSLFFFFFLAVLGLELRAYIHLEPLHQPFFYVRYF
jgi:hypothetical protein